MVWRCTAGASSRQRFSRLPRANLTGTYSNGASGIGATFTITATGTFSLDGVAINTIGQRVLLKNQATGFQNGVYTATVVGASLVSPVFTRALDYDQPSDINNTGAIPVQQGTANALSSWLLTSTVNTVGTDALVYAKFNLSPSTACPGGFGMWNCTVPNSAAFTFLNQGGAAATNGSRFMSILAPASASNSLRILHQACPATPWTLNVFAWATTESSGGSVFGGVEVDDGTKIVTLGTYSQGSSTTNYINTQNWTNVTTASGGPQGSIQLPSVSYPHWFQVVNDGTNLTYNSSQDGIAYQQISTSTITNFLSAATNCGVWVNTNAGSTVVAAVDVFSFQFGALVAQ